MSLDFKSTVSTSVSRSNAEESAKKLDGGHFINLFGLPKEVTVKKTSQPTNYEELLTIRANGSADKYVLYSVDRTDRMGNTAFILQFAYDTTSKEMINGSRDVSLDGVASELLVIAAYKALLSPELHTPFSVNKSRLYTAQWLMDNGLVFFDKEIKVKPSEMPVSIIGMSDLAPHGTDVERLYKIDKGMLSVEWTIAKSEVDKYTRKTTKVPGVDHVDSAGVAMGYLADGFNFRGAGHYSSPMGGLPANPYNARQQSWNHQQHMPADVMYRMQYQPHYQPLNGMVQNQQQMMQPMMPQGIPLPGMNPPPMGMGASQHQHDVSNLFGSSNSMQNAKEKLAVQIQSLRNKWDQLLRDALGDGDEVKSPEKLSLISLDELRDDMKSDSFIDVIVAQNDDSFPHRAKCEAILAYLYSPGFVESMIERVSRNANVMSFSPPQASITGNNW